MLAVNIAGIKMKTPVMAASGTFGFGSEYSDFVVLNKGTKPTQRDRICFWAESELIIVNEYFFYHSVVVIVIAMAVC